MNWAKARGTDLETASFSEAEYLQGEHVRGTTVLFSEVLKQKTRWHGFFRRRKVDTKVFVVSEEYLTLVEYEDRYKPWYGAFRVPYSMLRDLRLMSTKREILFHFDVAGPYPIRLGARAPQVFEAVSLRCERVRQAALSQPPPPPGVAVTSRPRGNAFKEFLLIATLVYGSLLLYPAALGGWMVGLGMLLLDKGETGEALAERRTTGLIMLAIGITATVLIKAGKGYLNRKDAATARRGQAGTTPMQDAQARQPAPEATAVSVAPPLPAPTLPLDIAEQAPPLHGDSRRLFNYGAGDIISKTELVERYARVRAETPEYFRGQVDLAFADLMRDATNGM